ncbi:2-hydroxyacid dehydrogenase [Massilia sp. CFBP9012]|uniref:2-hydroxyacid dehydrogenase n=1 Tax=Massilia sp. CFBP9012 TaxID=3096531 RepID=UPI002A6A86BC|nr:2-hydroxyacid dehydrogenase [Massilia sp. CFBP9012]MDY0973361.1 2-hydroxyacid dehydrogenase [Massilia sp. CFBP9012]
MKPEILVVGSVWSPEVRAQVEQAFQCHFVPAIPAAGDPDFQRIAGGIRAVLTTGTLGVTPALVASLPALEIVSVHGVGVDAVPLALLADKGIHVTNTPDVLTDDVADFAVTLLLSTVRRLPLLDRYVRSGGWPAKAPLTQARSLKGKVAGIVGFGRIGQAVAQRLQGFGMEIRYHQRSPGPAPEKRSSSLLALAEESDMLVLCMPGGPETRHMIGPDVIEALGPEGTLVNIARGSVVDEAALVAALQDGRLGAAGLDVFEDEPNVPEALFALDNVVLTPHVGSFTVEARRAMGRLAVANLLAHFDGEPLPTPVV